MSRGLPGTFVVLILLAMLGLELAADILQVDWLIAAMAAAFFGSTVRLVSNRPPSGIAAA